MSRNRFDDPRMWNPRIVRGFRLEKITIVAADNHVFSIDYPPYVELNPAGAIDVLMPAGAVANAGICFLISNISGSTITIKSSTDVAFTTTIVLLTIENTIVFCTGSTTEALAWRGMATATSA